MKLFIDSADINEVREAASWGIIDGATTNPSLIAKTGRPYADVLRQICESVDGPVSAEVVSTQAEVMLEEGTKLARIHPNIVVKCPATIEGLKAARALSPRGIKVNVTLIFSPLQGLAAAKCGASFVSAFAGRLDDIGQNGMAVVEQLVRIMRNYGYPTQVLVASIRSPGHVVRAAQAGADAVTIPFGVMGQMLHHPLTDSGLERFLADWRATRQKI
jgi:transaldolase